MGLRSHCLGQGIKTRQSTLLKAQLFLICRNPLSLEMSFQACVALSQSNAPPAPCPSLSPRDGARLKAERRGCLQGQEREAEGKAGRQMKQRKAWAREGMKRK